MRRAERLKYTRHEPGPALAAALGLALFALLAPPASARASLPVAGGELLSAAVQSSGGLPRFAGQHAGEPYLGIDVRDLAEQELAQLHLHSTHGAEIVRVDHDGPAGKVGLREHDVIVEMNGVAIDGQEQIRRMLRLLTPGNAVNLVISRDGQQKSIFTHMADRGEVERNAWSQHLIAPAAQAPSSAMPSGEIPELNRASNDPAPAPAHYGKGFFGSLLMSPSYTGAMLEFLGPQLAGFFGVPDGSGLLVRSVADDSPAARAGLRAGDIVLRANNKSMITLNDWAKQIRKAKGHPIALTVLRGKDQQTLTLTPDGKHRSSLAFPSDSVSMLDRAWARVSTF